MSQATTWNVPQAADAPVSPATYATRDKNSLDALLSANSGAAAPTYAVEGTLWKKTSGGLYLSVDGTNWVNAADLVGGDRAPVAESSATGTTLTIANLLKRTIYRTGPTAAYGDTTDTAANIVAGIPYAEVGNAFEFTFVNTVAFANTIAAGTGVTLQGVTSVSASSARRFLLELTNVTSGSEAVTLTGLMEGTI